MLNYAFHLHPKASILCCDSMANLFWNLSSAKVQYVETTNFGWLPSLWLHHGSIAINQLLTDSYAFKTYLNPNLPISLIHWSAKILVGAVIITGGGFLLLQDVIL